jgi:hypothetical protein
MVKGTRKGVGRIGVVEMAGGEAGEVLTLLSDTANDRLSRAMYL